MGLEPSERTWVQCKWAQNRGAWWVVIIQYTQKRETRRRSHHGGKHIVSNIYKLKEVARKLIRIQMQ